MHRFLIPKGFSREAPGFCCGCEDYAPGEGNDLQLPDGGWGCVLTSLKPCGLKAG
jgi:hypothetical protein